MAKNQAFLNLLNNAQLANQNEGERNPALDALLATAPTDANAFRKAILDHKGFWNKLQIDIAVTTAAAAVLPEVVPLTNPLTLVAAQAAYTAQETAVNVAALRATNDEATAVTARAAAAAAGNPALAAAANAAAAASKIASLQAVFLLKRATVCQTAAEAAAASRAATAAQVAIASEQAAQAVVPFIGPAERDDDNFLAPADALDFKLMRQLAANQRVMLGVQNAPEEVLINILSHNNDACREYLASKASKQFGSALASAPGWVKLADNAPPNTNTNTAVISEGDLEEIRKKASDVLLLQLVEQCNDPNVLTTLLALNTAGTPVDVARGLFPLRSLTTAKTAFIFSQPHPVVRDDPDLEPAISKRIAVLKQADAKKRFASYVKGLTNENLLDPVGAPAPIVLLESNDPDTLKTVYGGILIPDVAVTPADRDAQMAQFNQAKALLGERYLKAYITSPNFASMNAAALVTILNTNLTEAGMITELQRLIPVGPGDNNEYIEHAVKADFDAIRTAMVQKIISTATPADLDKLLNASRKGLPTFKEIIKANPFNIQNVDWIREHHYEAMKHSMGSAIFNNKLSGIPPVAGESAVSPFGLGAHPQLLKVFNALSSDQQRRFLDDKHAEYVPMHNLLKADNVGVARQYFKNDIDKGLIKSFVAENAKHSLVNKIHNSEVARILEKIQFPPPPSLRALTETDVRTINAVLSRYAVQNDLNDATKYNILKTELKNLCARKGVDAAFETAFNSVTQADVNTQQNHNVHILEFRKNHPGYEKFFDLLLSLKKDVTLDDNVARNHQLTTLKNNLNVLDRWTKFVPKTVAEFIETSIPDPKRDPRTGVTTPMEPWRRDLKNKLKTEFTSNLFNEIRAEIRAEELNKPGGNSKQVLKDMNQELSIIQKSNKSLADKGKRFKALEKISSIPLVRAMFLGKRTEIIPGSQTEQNPKGEEELQFDDDLHNDMLSECDTAIDELTRNYADIDAQRKVLPTGSPNSDIRALVKQLEVEKNVIKEQFDYYTKIKNQLNKVKDNKPDFVYGQKHDDTSTPNPTNVSFKDYNPGDVIPPLPGGGPHTLEASTSVKTPGSGQLLDLKIGQKSPPGATRMFLVGYKAIDDITKAPKGESYGRFSEKIGNIPGVEVTRNGLSPGVYTLEDFPKMPAGMNHRNAKDLNLLNAAKVEFSMIMAAQILAKLDKPPTKDDPLFLEGQEAEELQYLWTALVVLGKNTPKMEFDIDAIKVHAKNFDPNKEAQTSYFGKAKWQPDSLYKKTFVQHLGSDFTTQRAIASLTQVGEARKMDAKQVEALNKTVQNYKRDKEDASKAEKQAAEAAKDKVKTEGAASAVELTRQDPNNQ